MFAAITQVSLLFFSSNFLSNFSTQALLSPSVPLQSVAVSVPYSSSSSSGVPSFMILSLAGLGILLAGHLSSEVSISQVVLQYISVLARPH